MLPLKPINKDGSRNLLVRSVLMVFIGWSYIHANVKDQSNIGVGHVPQEIF